MFRILACLATLALALPADAAPRDQTHVRPLDANLARVIARGADRSSTIRSLIDRLQRSDVSVYLEYDMLLPSTLGGGLRFVTRAGSLRLLRISVSRNLSEAQLLRLIGHELQHALEVASAPEVVDEASLRAFYRALNEGDDTDRFDTEAARKAGDSVADDLRSGRRAAPELQGSLARVTPDRRRPQRSAR